MFFHQSRKIGALHADLSGSPGYIPPGIVQGLQKKQFFHGEVILVQDALFGGPGTDTVYGYERRDRLVGGKGSDLVVGGKGDDEMFGGSYDDVLIGGRGHDIIYGNRGKDRLYGNKGHDRLIASDGMADRLDGGPGVDRGRWDAKDRVRSVERRSRLK